MAGNTPSLAAGPVTIRVLRAALAKYELGAATRRSGPLPKHDVDDKGEQLTGAHKYVLYFDAGRLPPVATFWNLAMYGSDMLFVENDFGRYSFGSTDRWVEGGA